jgi:hypothetical protein
MSITAVLPKTACLMLTAALAWNLQGCNAGVSGDAPVVLPASSSAVNRVSVRLHTDTPAQVNADGLPITGVPAPDATWERRYSDLELIVLPTTAITDQVDLDLTNDAGQTTLSTLQLRVGAVVERPVDDVPPTITVTPSAAQTAPGGMTTWTITSSEDITWMLNDDRVIISGGTTTGWLSLDASHYSFLAYAQSTPGNLTITIPSRACTDLAGNFLTQATSISIPIIAP